MEQGLIRTGESENADELGKILREKHEEALRNLITGTTPKKVIFKRPARGGMQVDYIPGWWFIQQLNALFYHCWDLEVLNQDIGKMQVWALVKLTVRGPDGLVVTKTQFGGSDIKRLKGTETVIDVGDDLKSAVTDGLKKCATLLGIASDIYGHREQLEESGPDKSNVKALYSRGEKAGMSQEQVNEYCQKQYGKMPWELEMVVILGLINELRKKEKVDGQ